MQGQKKGAGIKPAPKTKTNYNILERLSLYFFTASLAVVSIVQFFPNERLLGVGLGIGMAGLITSCASSKTDPEIQEFDREE